MSRRPDHHRESQGRRGSRIDVEEGGRYPDIPETEHLRLTECPGNRGRYTPLTDPLSVAVTGSKGLPD
jgi:hypothetical protein